MTDSITSDHLTEFLEGILQLNHFRYRRGYKNVINKAIELNEKGVDCQLAIETSGHAAMKENYFLDDGAYLATKIVIRAAQLAAEGKTIDQLLDSLVLPKESREIRMKITCEEYQEFGDALLKEVKDWVPHSRAEVSCARKSTSPPRKAQNLFSTPSSFARFVMNSVSPSE